MKICLDEFYWLNLFAHEFFNVIHPILNEKKNEMHFGNVVYNIQSKIMIYKSNAHKKKKNCDGHKIFIFNTISVSVIKSMYYITQALYVIEN